MEKDVALNVLAALAQEARLDVFRLLVRAGSGGLAAGQIADQLEIPAATLSFHLKELKNAGSLSPIDIPMNDSIMHCNWFWRIERGS